MRQLAEDDFKKIIARRDSRYDGRFYFGVKTTKVYCRPVCPARPHPKNILIFKSLSEAEKSGFRPCLRCRPDAAPGSKILDGTSSTVSRALRLIDETGEEQLDVERLAQSLGMTDRHLRRLFDEHLGASPIEIMITKRLHFAKQLIEQTDTRLSEVAFAVGFQSIRRFNEAFKALYQQAPSAFRKNKHSRSSDEVALALHVREPYDWRMVLAYLKRHETYGVERVSETEFCRFMPIGDSYGRLRVSQGAKEGQLAVGLSGIPLTGFRAVLAKTRRLFDIEHNPHHLPSTKTLVSGGVRVPGCFDSFETAISIILCQLVSTTQAKQNLKSIVTRYGKRLGQTEGEGEIYAFPKPLVLASAPVEEIGLTRVKAHAIRELAKAVADGSLILSSSSDLEATKKRLLGIKGVGPWTVEMIAMRCLGDADAFPKNDLVVKKALESGVADEASWFSSRAYLTHCLWRDYGGKSK